jgi:asparagine synthase (glutamine-hydrolysing)
MCGIAGMVDLRGRRPAPRNALEAMARALEHRGPDENGFLELPGLGLASQRLSIVGLADGRQPIANEDGTVQVVFNGELFDHLDIRAALAERGHRLKTHADTEVLPHLWEDHHEDLFPHLQGQFAFALWDARLGRLTLARDRFGICPMYWTRQIVLGTEWLLFASEIKALLATGLVPATPNRRGINHLFSFFALPGPLTCFEGVQCLLPGRYLTIQTNADSPATVRERAYWEIDFPDRGDEDQERSIDGVVDEFESILRRAVERRLRADVPVVAYLSGGVDSSTVVALAGQVLRQPIPAFTVRILSPELDESPEAGLVARHLGCRQIVATVGHREVLESYPELIRAAEGPVIDTACAALLRLAREVHQQGYKVAVTGEGADEWLAGYPWFKLNKLLSYLDCLPGLSLSQMARRAFLRISGAPRFPWSLVRRQHEITGGHNAWMEAYGLMGMSKLRFYSDEMLELAFEHIPYADLGLNSERMKRWHPLNRSVYFGARIMLPGLLLAAKGDRVAMNSSVETRYPFLDEEVFAFCAKLRPALKLRGMCEKYVLHRLAERWLPRAIAWRKKAMFRAPFDSFYLEDTPAFVDQLLSMESLRRTGYFDPEKVAYWRTMFRNFRQGSSQRTSVEMGLVGVVSTQLWHHTFIDGSLAELPTLATGTPRAATAASPMADSSNGLVASAKPQAGVK